jgi:Dolichyl-phosphate-mannose-protein mannosyltransferase
MVSPPALTPQGILLALLVFAAFIGIARRSRAWVTYPARISRLLTHRAAPIAAGLVTVAIVAFVWRSFDQPGVIHDERAYLLQAEIFASGRWTAPQPPMSEFFEQMHVFIEPAVFAKYPPAHALTLVPGIWVGLPGLMPALLTGISGALIFAIARRLANEWVALLTWWLWSTAWPTLLWSASYFSETTSSAAWLVAVWATLVWLESERKRYLIYAAMAVAWGFMARPLTLAALSLPLAFVIARRLIAERAWRALAGPAVAATAILLLVPVWNAETLGDWRRDPYSEYSRRYFPFDTIGFGVDPTPPVRPLTPELERVGAWSREVHETHVPSKLPAAFGLRLFAILFWVTDGWRLALGALVLAGVRHGTAAERFCLVPVALLMLAYLAFAHPPMWIVYYLEVLPIFYYLAARQLGRLFQTSGGASESSLRWPASAANAALAAFALVLPLGLSDGYRVRAAVDLRNAFHRAARTAIDDLPRSNAIVFVRYAPDHSPHLALTRNEPDLASAAKWLVYDRGARNAELASIAPGRTPYLFDTGSFRIAPLSGSGAGKATTRPVEAGEQPRRTVATQ